MTEQFDAIVIGMGPGGEVAASRLLAAGKRVAVIERELIGGECGYWACIPSTTLRPPEALGEVDRAAGVGGPPGLGGRTWIPSARIRSPRISPTRGSARESQRRGEDAVVCRIIEAAPDTS
jgi:choline dehydrogenase-like flavoprotein